MNVSLTKELEQLVNDKVKSGLYLSASEVVREALRLLDERDRLKSLRIEELRRDIQEGLNSGPSAAFDAADLKRRVRNRVKSSRRQ
ncbi:MAG: type II toxin-antitoxin system ParD family antitoxin [bacterium]|nr:type II toxin-antitoxin system ParD family antitoxin [bacterium]